MPKKKSGKALKARNARLKIHFVKHRFALSDKENRRLYALSEQQHTTPNKIIKSALREYVKAHYKKEPEVNANQLSLFANPPTVQYSLLEGLI